MPATRTYHAAFIVHLNDFSFRDASELEEARRGHKIMICSVSIDCKIERPKSAICIPETEILSESADDLLFRNFCRRENIAF